MNTASPVERPVAEPQEAPSTQPSDPSPVRVLLVEDDYDSVQLVSQRLNATSLARFEVSWAASLPEGVAHLEQGDYDAVILDLSLPGSEGVATIAGVAAAARRIPIVVLTGSDNLDLAMAAARSGVKDYLVKQDQKAGSLVRAILTAIQRQRGAPDRPPRRADPLA
jgi:DNA-binding response OmpR family regulator